MLLCWLNELNKSDVSIAGGKGASLGEMLQAGLPVPDGFVVLANAYELFLENNLLHEKIEKTLSGVDINDLATFDAASKKIQDLFEQASMDQALIERIKKYFDKLDCEFVAVRSSATAEDGATNAWAGQLDTFLNTKSDQLIRNIKLCWASLFSPRAIMYRLSNGLLDIKISVAVVVQRMIDSEISGVAFSVNPINKDPNQIIIESVYGLGESLVSGEVTPDDYIVSKEPSEIISETITAQPKGIYRTAGGGNSWQDVSAEFSSKRKLTDEQILFLSQLVSDIEKHYKYPCDVEWALEKGKFYITQSRPITTLQ